MRLTHWEVLHKGHTSYCFLHSDIASWLPTGWIQPQICVQALLCPSFLSLTHTTYTPHVQMHTPHITYIPHAHTHINAPHTYHIHTHIHAYTHTHHTHCVFQNVAWNSFRLRPSLSRSPQSLLSLIATHVFGFTHLPYLDTKSVWVYKTLESTNLKTYFKFYHPEVCTVEQQVVPSK